MTDIVEVLRDKMLPHLTCNTIRATANEAADEIERLREEVRTLRNELAYVTKSRDIWRDANDIVEELRDPFYVNHSIQAVSHVVASKAADEIESLRLAYKRLSEGCEQLKADATCWRYVRDNLLRTRSTNGAYLAWAFDDTLFAARHGETSDQFIHRLIAKQKEARND
jgi:archaellum component FlaC